MSFNPFTGRWSLRAKLTVIYIIVLAVAAIWLLSQRSLLLVIIGCVFAVADFLAIVRSVASIVHRSDDKDPPMFGSGS